mmetsp:Transcript_408/g.749  ORF Transcript_408/g.749 Transcript_408/m.749 type:complete len:768 (+) Transcript_408:51-2354(+)
MKHRHRKSIAPREREYDSDDSLDQLTPKKMINLSSTHSRSRKTPKRSTQQGREKTLNIQNGESNFRRTSTLSTSSFTKTLDEKIKPGKRYHHSLKPTPTTPSNRDLVTKNKVSNDTTIDHFDDMYDSLKNTIKMSEKKMIDYNNHERNLKKTKKRRKSVTKRKASLMTLPSSLKYVGTYTPKHKRVNKTSPTLKEEQNNHSPKDSDMDPKHSLLLPIALSPDIRSKIHKLRSDPSELDSFHHIVEKIQKERGIHSSAKKLKPLTNSPMHRVSAIEKKDLVLYNPNLNHMNKKSKKRVRSKKQQTETRWEISERHAHNLRLKMEKAITKHESLQRKKLMKNMAIAFAPKTGYEELDNRIERLKEYNDRIQASEWKTFAVLFRFTRFLNHKLVHSRMDRLHTVVINEDADDIAHSLFRLHHEECSRTMRKERVHPIATNAYIARFRYLVSRKQLAAKMIREFFLWQNDIAHSRVLITQYIERVRRGQRMVRAFINIRKARIELLKRQFDKYENERIQKRRDPLVRQQRSLSTRVQELERKIAHKKSLIGSSSNHWASNVEFAALNAKMMEHYNSLVQKLKEIEERLNDKKEWLPFPDTLKYAYIKSYLQKRNMAHVRLQVKLSNHYRLFSRFKKRSLPDDTLSPSPIAIDITSPSPILIEGGNPSSVFKTKESRKEFNVGRQPILIEKNSLPEVYQDIKMLYETEQNKLVEAKKMKRLSRFSRRESLHSLSSTDPSEGVPTPKHASSGSFGKFNRSVLFTQTTHDLTSL